MIFSVFPFWVNSVLEGTNGKDPYSVSVTSDLVAQLSRETVFPVITVTTFFWGGAIVGKRQLVGK